MGTYIFDHAHPKNLYQVIYKISQFHLFIHQIQSTLESRDQIVCTIFDHAQPKNFALTFNSWEFESKFKKKACLIDLFWIKISIKMQKMRLFNQFLSDSQFKNHATWLVKSIWAYISGTRFYSNIVIWGKYRMVLTNLSFISTLQ